MVETGGAERMVSSVSQLLASAGLEVHEASFDPPGARRRFETAAAFHPLGPVPRLPLPLRALEYFIAARRLRRLKRRLRIDVTISNLWRADLISAISGGRDRKIALCHINIIGNPSNRQMLRFRPFVALVYRRFDRVLGVNALLAEEVAGLYKLSADRVGFIENFVARPQVASALPRDGVVRFVWCGRMNPEKNAAGLLAAWKEFGAPLRGVQLLLAGDGPLRGELESLARSLGLRSGPIEDPLTQIVFLGFVSEPARYMAGARALLLSSLHEGLPMVILEALALGTPVLAADCPAGGVRAALLGAGVCDLDRSAIEPALCGALLPAPRADRPQSLALWREALDIALNDPGALERWGRGALERAKRFSSEAACNRWLEEIAPAVQSP
ncbi:glycosyl transferase [Methylocystis bryophila]|nr:glycosyl transferase [Methylocystis bryophila]